MNTIAPSNSPTLSFVVPMYNENAAIPIFLKRVRAVMESLGESYEIVCVNDGSTDETLSQLIEAQKTDARLKVVDLSRNFGKEVALTAGIDHASGKAVIPIDADLQDPPEIIGEMVNKWREGYEVVIAIRSDRSVDSFLKRNAAKWFYSVMKRMGEISIPPNAGDFRLMDRKVVDSLKRVTERTRFMKGLFAWLGYKKAVVYFVREKRAAGQTSWRYWKLWNFALEGIVSFSSLPLRIWSYLGVFTSLGALLYMFVIIGRTLFSGVDVPGYASLMVVILFFSGINLICLGVMGEYLSRIFIEVKQRPLYLVREKYGFESE
ncbi:MAG: glycosyltransferase family 2 protein [Pseudodesulfovibrio sp.]|nr:glycosyltransferase family 2 protein [Pseudodesulfovibrio sp.]